MMFGFKIPLALIFVLGAGAVTSQVLADNLNDEPFYAFQDRKAFVEKDSMYRADNAVIFKYRIDVEDSNHPW